MFYQSGGFLESHGAHADDPWPCEPQCRYILRIQTERSAWFGGRVCSLVDTVILHAFGSAGRNWPSAKQPVRPLVSASAQTDIGDVDGRCALEILFVEHLGGCG